MSIDDEFNEIMGECHSCFAKPDEDYAFAGCSECDWETCDDCADTCEECDTDHLCPWCLPPLGGHYDCRGDS